MSVNRDDGDFQHAALYTPVYANKLTKREDPGLYKTTCFHKKGDFKVEGKQDTNTWKPAAFACGVPRNGPGTKVRRLRAAVAVGIVQQRSDGAAWQDLGGTAQIEPRISSGSAPGTTG